MLIPNLSSAPATHEDLVAWDHALVRMLRGRKMGSYMNLYMRSLTTDRREATLMLEARIRREGYPCWAAVTVEEMWFGGPPDGAYRMPRGHFIK
jgi:hypothetical protein